MSEQSTTILKDPRLKPAEDFYNLRREGIRYIEQMASQLWTDYNTHDPGITILDALCYAMTDLAYRIGWDIQDLLLTDSPPLDLNDPYPNQPFFTAREILTVNPWTPEDFRRLLIDLELVRNAWVFCRKQVCDIQYFAWCEEDELLLSYQPPTNKIQQYKAVDSRGLYDVLLEFESDPAFGDLNDRKIEHSFEVVDANGSLHPITMELRFPDWELENRAARDLFFRRDDAFTNENGASYTLAVSRLGATKNYDVQTDPELSADERDAYLRRRWRSIFYVSFTLTMHPGGETILINHAALRLIASTVARDAINVPDLVEILADHTPAGFIQRYRLKLLKVEEVTSRAKKILHERRNLAEDYCCIAGVSIEDVSVCADIDVTPDADIEQIQAQIWLEIEQYFNPAVPFHTVQDLQDDGVSVENIFNGPKLDSGFIKTDELKAAQLRTELRTSDIINLLMDIEGVVAVKNLLLSKYDAEGNPVPGAADPNRSSGTPIFEPNKISASWVLLVTMLHQPRLYYGQSRFHFFKDGLPFSPRMDEALDTLTQLRGETERPKLLNSPNDLKEPVGTLRHMDMNVPAHYSLPFTYGIGAAGLPSDASPLRRAQAKQLKAYLLVFEQLLANAFTQVAKTASLFSLDPTIARTYFVRTFNESLIQGYDQINGGLNQSELENMTETVPEFLERRNRFLNHIMARFGEQFSDYALLLTNQNGQQVARERLIEDKIAFLNDYPQVSHDRGKAFNYRDDACTPDAWPGLKKRISLLLGYPNLKFVWEVTSQASGHYKVAFELRNPHDAIWLEGELTIASNRQDTVTTQAFRDIVAQMIRPDAYMLESHSDHFHLHLKDKDGLPLGQSPPTRKLATREDAMKERDELLSWSSNERAILVEHLLLRPKFIGDALYPACSEGPCDTCGEEDPYSFRLTFVMPGWAAPYNENLDMRRFADRTIRQETPAHILSKICWVGNDGFIADPCDPVIDDLVHALTTKGFTAGGDRPNHEEACSCAAAIYESFSAVFEKWYEDKTLTYFQPDNLQKILNKEFRTRITAADIACTTILASPLWRELEQLMVRYFQQVVLEGWQFERFEDAWCKWLEENAKFDWTEERLHERLQAILAQNITNSPIAEPGQEDPLKSYATTLLRQYGTEFYSWMEANIKDGNTIHTLTNFAPDSIILRPDFTYKPDTAAYVNSFLHSFYEEYISVSYHLWMVVLRLNELRSVYPPATLHDCDDGSDQNPVRLGQTALGNRQV